MAGFREEIQKRFDKKKAEVSDLEVQLREARSYLQALEDMLKLIPRDGTSQAVEEPSQVLRPGSIVAKAREIILAARQPLTIVEILQRMGRPTDGATRASVSAPIAAYVRKNEIFTRPAPNTFGLIELKNVASKEMPTKISEPVPPPDFGSEPEEAVDDPFMNALEKPVSDDEVPF